MKHENDIIVIDALGTITKGFIQGLGDLEIRGPERKKERKKEKLVKK